MIQDGATVTIADQKNVVHGLSNRAILNVLERPQTYISRSSHSLMLNICEIAKKYGHSYYGRRIGNHIQAFKLYHFQ